MSNKVKQKKHCFSSFRMLRPKITRKQRLNSYSSTIVAPFPAIFLSIDRTKIRIFRQGLKDGVLPWWE